MPGPGRRWKPGQSGNPNGRPPAAKGLAAAIGKVTRDGKEIWEFWLAVMRADKSVSTPLVNAEGEPITDKEGNTIFIPPSVKFRLLASELLAKRRWGKETEGQPDPSEPEEEVSAEELAAFTAVPVDAPQEAQ